MPGKTHQLVLCSVFNGEPIPYPKRECIADEDNKDDKNDAGGAGKEQVCISIANTCNYLSFILTEE